MSEPTAVAESVTSTDVSVTVDPAQLNKPVHPSAQDESSDLLKHKLGLANAHAKQAKKEKDDLQRQFDELKAQMAQVQDAQQSAVRQNLEDQGAFRELYEQEKARAKQLESRLLNETASLKQELESVAQSAKKGAAESFRVDCDWPCQRSKPAADVHAVAVRLTDRRRRQPGVSQLGRGATTGRLSRRSEAIG